MVLVQMKLNASNRFDLETWNLPGQGHRQRSQRVELIKVYLHVKFETGIVNGHSTMNLNARAKPNCWHSRMAPFHRPEFVLQYGQLDMCLWNTDAPASNKVKILQKSRSPTFWLCPTPRGMYVMSVKCEEPIDELLVQVWLLYHHPNFRYLDIALCLKAGRNYRRTDKWTFQAGGIKIVLRWGCYGSMWKVLSDTRNTHMKSIS